MSQKIRATSSFGNNLRIIPSIDKSTHGQDRINFASCIVTLASRTPSVHGAQVPCRAQNLFLPDSSTSSGENFSIFKADD